MAVSEQLQTLVARMPDPDARGMFTENIDKDQIDSALAAIHAGGSDFVRGLVELLAEPGSEADVKPHYALHNLANHVVSKKDAQARRALGEVLAEALSGDHSAYVKSFLCQTLQWCGRRESVAALGRLLTDEQLCDPAAMALVAIQDGAAEALRAALPEARGRCRLTILHSLAALADPGADAAFRQALRDEDREIRLAAGAGLARLGSAGAVDLLLAAADVPPGWERVQAAKHCLVLAEKLSAAGNPTAARRIYERLRDTRRDPHEAYLREVAEKALATTV